MKEPIRVMPQMHFTAAELAALDVAAERSYFRRGELVAWIVREWLADPKAAMPAIAQSDIEQLTAVRREQLDQRADVVRRWEAARVRAVKRKRTREAATTDLLHSLERRRGLKVSRATLFNWYARYRKSGLAGLVDRRWISAVRR